MKWVIIVDEKNVFFYLACKKKCVILQYENDR